MRAYVGVGSNLGDRWAHLATAAAILRRSPRVSVLRASRVYDTVPIGPPQPRYLNAALELDTALPPRALHGVLQMAENAAGRRRSGRRYLARTLDLDLLLYGEEVILDERLRVPHPELTVRRFVLAPLAELCPELVVPGTGRSVAELLARAPPDEVVAVGLYPL
ncbi:MAG TPA: 2-amino-4-hydroxy-6-hydroxymethyldihydropteridine diphosphokinase [Anaeromyxobacter sp.]|nr:2-amino-4-hydroxy-6-hydroxymethyldihydropteridine diphosphokinase [Anaeromyxobacter sp.]